MTNLIRIQGFIETNPDEHAEWKKMLMLEKFSEVKFMVMRITPAKKVGIVIAIFHLKYIRIFSLSQHANVKTSAQIFLLQTFPSFSFWLCLMSSKLWFTPSMDQCLLSVRCSSNATLVLQ